MTTTPKLFHDLKRKRNVLAFRMDKEPEDELHTIVTTPIDIREATNVAQDVSSGLWTVKDFSARFRLLHNQ